MKNHNRLKRLEKSVNEIVNPHEVLKLVQLQGESDGEFLIRQLNAGITLEQLVHQSRQIDETEKSKS